MRTFIWVLYFAFIVLTITACFWPNLVEMGYQTDKMMHITFVCVALIWPCLTFNKWRHIFLLSGLFLIGGIGVEILQGLTPDRKTEWDDILANIIGILIGLLIGYLLRSGYEAEIKQKEK